MSLSFIKIELAFILRPDIALINSALLHEVDEGDEVVPHVVDRPTLPILKLTQQCLDQSCVHLSNLPHVLLVLGCNQAGTGRVS